MTNPNFECYLEIDFGAGYVRVFRQLSDETTDEVHGVVFGHKKHKSSAGTLTDIKNQVFAPHIMMYKVLQFISLEKQIKNGLIKL
jgi:hypothetical protein